MTMLHVLLVLCSIHPFVNGVGFRGFTYEGLKEPYKVSQRFEKIITGWIIQPLDHFNHRDNRTWSMRYYQNSERLRRDSPIFIMIGGEGQISTGFLQNGLMYEIAATHEALMYYTEHRFYGKSRPTEDTSTANLQYLNVDQALADLAYFIEAKKKENNLEKSPVILFGGSYAGNMAAWARLKYPHLIQGALASSAPVYAKADFYEYYEGVAKSLGRYSEKCVEDIEIAFKSVEKLLTTQDGPQKLKLYFNFCDVPDVKNASELGYLMTVLAEVIAATVQHDQGTKISILCNKMTATHLGSPLERLAHVVSESFFTNKCRDIKYNNFIQIYREISWESPSVINMRLWYHQTCTEFGYYQTINSNKIFGTLLPLSYFINLCMDLYDYDEEETLNSRVERTNLMYGGQLPDVRNVIFTNGDIDPWHALSVLEDLNDSSPAIFINGSSHCRDLFGDASTDTIDLKNARVRIRRIISRWISSWQKAMKI